MLLQAGSNCEVIYRRDPWKLIIQSNWALDKWDPIRLFNLEKTPLEKPKDDLIDNPLYKNLVDELMNEYMKIRQSEVRTVKNG